MNKTQILKDFTELVAIESVSADPQRYSQIETAAHWVKAKLHALGFDVELMEKSAQPPLVVAKRTVSPTAKTIGIYAHYDVQPEDPVGEWLTPPFTLTERAGKYWGRGVADDKGHLIQNLAALGVLIKEKKLHNNIVCVFEGEEENGSLNFEAMVKRAQHLIQDCDVFYIVDGALKSKGVPKIEYGLRGLVYFELSVKAGESDLHSGLYGNAVYNPAQVMADLFAQMKDVHTGCILIPKIDAALRKPDAAEMAMLQRYPTTDAQLLAETRAYGLIQDKMPTYLKPLLLPSLDIHGFVAGYTGAGAKTVIPKEARVKFSLRLIEHMDPDDIENQVKNFIKRQMPPGIKYELHAHSKAAPFFTDINNEFMRETARLLKQTFGHETVFSRSGGTIPAAEILNRLFKKPSIIIGFNLPDMQIHAPNENIDVATFWKGIEALKKIYAS